MIYEIVYTGFYLGVGSWESEVAKDEMERQKWYVAGQISNRWTEARGAESTPSSISGT